MPFLKGEFDMIHLQTHPIDPSTLLEIPRSNVQRSSWGRHIVEYNSLNSKPKMAMTLLFLAVMTLASVYSTQELIDSEMGNLFLGLMACTTLFALPMTSAVMDIGYRCKNPRLIDSPALLITAGLVAACATVLIRRSQADHSITAYYDNQIWVNKTLLALEENCKSMVLANPDQWTAEQCVVCDTETTTLDTSMDGPYQSLYLKPVSIFLRDRDGHCNLPEEAINVTISANRSELGRNYFCGLPYETNNTVTTTTAVIEECIYNLIPVQSCYYPPLYLQGFASKAWISLGGFMSAHLSLVERCSPNQRDDFCYGLYHYSCDTDAAAVFFANLETQFELVRNETLSYPEDAEPFLERSKDAGFALPLAMGLFIPVAAIYEILATRRFHRKQLLREQR